MRREREYTVSNLCLVCVDWWCVAGIPHLESLQVLSNMSQNNIREALSQFDREERRNVETHLANVEASFDLGYLQTDDGWFH